MRDYLVIHLSGIAVALLALVVIWFFPNRVVIFVFFAFVFTPAVCFNIISHSGT